jgi:glycyl-tRNA synthetase beta chain
LYKQGKVIADIEQRKAIIKAAAQAAAAKVGGIAHIEEDLLEEIAALNEFPVPIIGGFHDRFLALPAEVLITTMQTNQKYFPVKNAEGGLLAHFITFSNIESTRPESIQQGNERVVTPRLSDAEFFWNQDRKQTLAERVLSLSNIVFQEKLGTVADKTHRVIKVAEFIAQHLNADVELAKRAALLAKADLLTSMVGEFGNLQGIMGRYYALAEGEASEVAWAIEEQYFPKQSGSPTASSQTGQILAIAEKIDTLTGIFSAGLIPTGDKDPYALRRAALGALRTLIENNLTLDICKVIEFSLSLFTHSFDVAATETAVIDFVFDRLKGYCLDKGYSADEFDAVITLKPTDPLDFMQRLAAVKAFRQLPEAASLAAANKRIRNILKKSASSAADTVGKLVETPKSNELHFLGHRGLSATIELTPIEFTLLDSAKLSAVDIAPLLAQRDYRATLTRLAALREDVDAFFDNVMVMCEDEQLRAHRLALLNMLSEQFLTCADISKLQS